VFNIGTYLIDSIDFKIHEKEGLLGKQINEHPMIIKARNFLLEQATNRLKTTSSQNSSRNIKYSFKKLFGFEK
jgi:hypothetical protein